MSKVIAVIDKPKDCEHCPCFRIGSVYDLCQLAMQTKSFKETGIPDWCPLREVPQKQKHSCIDNEFQRGAKSGYNACIDEIMKGSEENG